METLFHYDRTGFTFDVFPNRIEVAEKGLFKTNKTTILIKTITNVEIVGITKKLKITTQDKKTHEFQIGTNAPAARDTILAQL
jgi:hypothetical protein